MEYRTVETCAAYMLGRLGALREQNPNLRLLDIGAGPGTITAGFARAIPEGHVTAVDLKSEALSGARNLAEAAGVRNIEFQQASIHKLPFADGAFDVTHCHQVLTHVEAPWDALREMMRVTKPGGIVAAREGDQDSEILWPLTPGLLKFHSTIAKMMKGAGGTVTAARDLLPWALRAGAKMDQITHSYSTWWHSTQTAKDNWSKLCIVV